MGYFIITDSNWAKAEERNTQPCRDLPQGIRGTKQAHRLAAQR